MDLASVSCIFANNLLKTTKKSLFYFYFFVLEKRRSEEESKVDDCKETKIVYLLSKCDYWSECTVAYQTKWIFEHRID